jgi:hypothetical protein
MKYIHLNCIKHWLNSKKTVKEGKYYYTVMYQTVTCELCKEPFKSILNHQGKAIHLLDYQKPNSSNWLVFEALNTENLFDEKVKIFHVFDFHDLLILSVGRGHSAHAKISDISISRTH